MPGISGLEFARQVPQICPTLPVVVTSGYIDDELRANAQQAGVVALMPKPFTRKASSRSTEARAPNIPRINSRRHNGIVDLIEGHAH